MFSHCILKVSIEEALNIFGKWLLDQDVIDKQAETYYQAIDICNIQNTYQFNNEF